MVVSHRKRWQYDEQVNSIRGAKAIRCPGRFARTARDRYLDCYRKMGDTDLTAIGLRDYSHKNRESGYWGRKLARKSVAGGVFQLHEANAPPEMVSAHGHDHAHIVFVTSGAYVTSVTGENAFIARPVAVINPPGTWHRDHFVGGTGSFMTVDLEIDNLSADHVRHCESTRVLQFCHHLSQKIDRKNSLELEDDLDSLASLFIHARPNDLAGVPQGVERAFQAIMDARRPWLFTMPELARIAGVHENHLPRAFRQRFGMSASKMVAARQIELCAAALLKAGTSLADTAIEYGFYDQAHMAIRFRQHLRQSPSQWRAAHMTKG